MSGKFRSLIWVSSRGIQHVVEPQRGKTRGPYTKFTPEQKAEIGKRAAEHGVVATVRYYEKRFPGKLAPAVSENGRGQLESSIREIYFHENFVRRKFGAIRYSLTWQTDRCSPRKMALKALLNAKAALS